jgi:hypothetical protein
MSTDRKLHQVVSVRRLYDNPDRQATWALEQWEDITEYAKVDFDGLHEWI